MASFILLAIVAAMVLVLGLIGRVEQGSAVERSFSHSVLVYGIFLLMFAVIGGLCYSLAQSVPVFHP